MNVVATSLASGSAPDVVEALQSDLLAQLDWRKPAFTLLFASTKQPLQTLMPLFKESWPHLLLGASTAGEFTEKGDAKGSVAAVAVAGDFYAHAGIGRGLKANPEQAVADALKGHPATAPGLPHRTGIMLMDPLAGRSEKVVEAASKLIGTRTVLAGGAAGDDLAMKSTFVGVDRDVATDAVVMLSLFSTKQLGIGVHHGHHPLSRHLEVTRSEGNVVYELNRRPAWEVWKEQTRERAEAEGWNLDAMPTDQVGAFLLRYEAGISVGSELRIRAPLAASPDGSITFACGIPKGTKIRITESTSARQVSSARAAARLARSQSRTNSAGAIVFDCICRNLILGKEFGSAVKAISEELGGAKLAGFETYGEIALEAGDMSGFHNTTTVVLSIPA